MNKIKDYYNEHVLSLTGIDFDELTHKQKHDIANTANFAYWNIYKQMETYKKETIQSYNDALKMFCKNIDGMLIDIQNLMDQK